MDSFAVDDAIREAVRSPAVAVAGAFAVGALLGSFLNVVVHRVPRGESFVGGRSRCPACGARVRARDNVPILGWLVLRGRCRDCRQSISARYPLVEAACGLLLALLAVSIHVAPGPVPLVVWIDRAAIVLVLTAWLLLADVGHLVRGSTAAAVALLAAVAAAAWPGLAPLGTAIDGSPWPSDPGWLAAPVASGAGACAGWIGGWACAGPVGRNALVVVGAALGWQAAMLGTAATLGLRALVTNRATIPWAVTAGSHGLLILWPFGSRAWDAVRAWLSAG